MKEAMVRGLGLMLLVLMLGPALAGAQSPPRELKKVGDHWTAWDPPATVEEGAQVYVIVSGDTLWDLAERFYQNPYLWPQLWERNQYILDAHWIYPGDPLVLGIEVESAEMLGEELRRGKAGTGEAGGEDDFLKSRGGPSTFGGRGPEGSFVQLGTADDIYCSGYIGEPKESFPFRVTGSEYDLQNPNVDFLRRGLISSVYGNVDAGRINLTLGDIVYVDGGRNDGVSPGDVFVSIRIGERVRHPATHRVLGRLYSYQGRIRILTVQENASIGEISQVCEPVTVGSGLTPFVPEPIPSERRTPMRSANVPVQPEELRRAPVIIHSRREIVTLGQDSVVWVGLGESDDVIPGDIFTIYRQGRRRNPPVVLGELAILSVHRTSSVAKIINSRFPIYVGDPMLPK